MFRRRAFDAYTDVNCGMGHASVCIQILMTKLRGLNVENQRQKVWPLGLFDAMALTAQEVRTEPAQHRWIHFPSVDY